MYWVSFVDPIGRCKSLQLERAPRYLRVVINDKREVDALDQLEDTPASDELVVAYELDGDYGSMHIDRRDKKTGRRIGEWYKTAQYKRIMEQPNELLMRENESWRRWCQERAAQREAEEQPPET